MVRVPCHPLCLAGFVPQLFSRIEDFAKLVPSFEPLHLGIVKLAAIGAGLFESSLRFNHCVEDRIRPSWYCTRRYYISILTVSELLEQSKLNST